MSVVIPDIHPSIQNVKAILTTKWGGSGYRPRIIRSIESYYIDTALDNDADTWTVDIGDPNAELHDLLERDNEIRMQFYGVGPSSADYLLTGIADQATFNEEGVWSIVGRDLSSLATDSIMRPAQFKHARAWSIVDEQARYLGFRNTSLMQRGQVKKLNYTDGSESYWEFWYRLYRKEKAWIWCDPDGTLIANILNYDAAPSYYFGEAASGDTNLQQSLRVPVESCEIVKTSQGRVGEVWVFGHKGDNGFLTKVEDGDTAGWLKRPRRILLDTEAHTATSAEKLGLEEIFESKVGALEIKLSLTDTNFSYKQNTIADVNLPLMGISGKFFVVGVRRQGGSNGLVQEIRLRERKYALTNRTPTDPKVKQTEAPRNPAVTGDLGDAVGNFDRNWGPYFVAAAKEFHGPWDFSLFLATLLGIADQEHGGAPKNERANGGPGGDHIEWYPYAGQQGGGGNVASGESREHWEAQFANEPGTYTDQTFAVGVMQLYSLGYKHDADDHLKAGYRNEYAGGRWHPEHNIWAGAKALREKLKIAVSDSGRDIDMWAGVSLYGHNAQLYSPGHPTPYALSVKNKVYNDPNYLGQVSDALKTARDAAATSDSAGASSSDSASEAGPYKNSAASLKSLTYLRRNDSSVDLEHVNYVLLNSLNSLGARLGKVITITSGYRSYDDQVRLYKIYQDCGYCTAHIAAKPGTSNHERGEACDCTIGGVAICNAVSAGILAVYNLHCTVSGDPVHITRMAVSG
jgi:prophage tail gpP-like protein/uncharacterized protein YcbK (DUF882 family)